MQTAQCPNCQSDVIVDDQTAENDLLTCVNCGAELEVISLHPLQIQSLASE